MRLLGKKKKSGSKKDDMIKEIRGRLGRKGQYQKQDQLSEVEDHRYSQKTEPMYHKFELEDKKDQPSFKKNPSKGDIKNVRTNSHKKSVEPPDEDAMEEYPPSNTKNTLGKEAKKKVSIRAISRRMKKKR